jgi:hypothetical protein
MGVCVRGGNSSYSHTHWTYAITTAGSQACSYVCTIVGGAKPVKTGAAFHAEIAQSVPAAVSEFITAIAHLVVFDDSRSISNEASVIEIIIKCTR